eukprot:15452733-Alexandrium_andersonii.AAC.1
MVGPAKRLTHVVMPKLPAMLGPLEVRRYRVGMPMPIGVGGWRSLLSRFILQGQWRLSVVPCPWIVILIRFE